MALGKRLGFSFEEMNETTTQGFLDILHAYAGDDDEAPRRASGREAEAFFG